jgi:hypothetical protein
MSGFTALDRFVTGHGSEIHSPRRRSPPAPSARPDSGMIDLRKVLPEKGRYAVALILRDVLQFMSDQL